MIKNIGVIGEILILIALAAEILNYYPIKFTFYEICATSLIIFEIIRILFTQRI